MNKGEFIALLNHPQEIDKALIPEVQTVVNNYPYFQSAQLLLTKAFHDSGNLNFESSLKRTAAYAADRKKLHSLLFNDINAQPLEVESSKTEELSYPTESQTLEEAITAELTAPIEEAKHIENATIEEHTHDVKPSEEDSTSPSLEQLNQNNFEEKYTPETEFKEETKSDILEDKLERQIMSSAISNSILMEVSNEIPAIESLPISPKIDKNETSYTKTIPVETDESERSFTDWIKHLADDPAEERENEKDINNSLYIRVSQQKAEFYSATKMAKLSVQEDDDLVTETLANIYADQGNLDKAIKAFQKLQLKYPEKRVYFAGRIKEIQNQINS